MVNEPSVFELSRFDCSIKCIWNHEFIVLDGFYLTFFSNKKLKKKIGYDSKWGRERINLLSMTSFGVYDPFGIIDFLSRCSSWFWDKICNVLQNLFISNLPSRLWTSPWLSWPRPRLWPSRLLPRLWPSRPRPWLSRPRYFRSSICPLYT